MAFVNFSTREITAKIVYYGPGLCGKTTSLQYIFDSIVPENKGEMVSLATDVDRTIYFDFLPLTLGKIQNFTARIQLYTVPGQVRYNSTRKLVLSGTDGVVFVADSQADLMDENMKSYQNLIDNLEEQARNLSSMPHIMQYNKRDLPKLASVEDLNRRLNKQRAPHFETCATAGTGILEGLKATSKLVMQDLNKRGVVDKKRVRTFVPRSQTDSIARPMVGAAVVVPTGSGAAGDKDSVSEFISTATPSSRAPYYSGPFDEEQDVLDALNTRQPDPYGLEDSQPGLSFSAVFDDPELASRIRILESELPVGEQKELVTQARDIFEQLLDDEDVFSEDMPPSSRVAMLGVSLRRYAHFQRLLAASTLDRVDGAFILHFLTDLQFGKTIG